MEALHLLSCYSGGESHSNHLACATLFYAAPFRRSSIEMEIDPALADLLLDQWG